MQCQLLQASGDARAVKVKQLADQLTLGHQRNERIVGLLDEHRFDEENGALRLVMSKALTIGIEQNNGRQRHWFARFRRKSIVVSKSREMVDLTLFLFAAYHVNSSIHLPSLFT